MPNYYNNDRPIGTWYAKQLWSLGGWMNDSNRSFDIGAAVMWSNSANQRIADVTGGQGIRWNGARGQSVYHWAYRPTRRSTASRCSTARAPRSTGAVTSG